MRDKNRVKIVNKTPEEKQARHQDKRKKIAFVLVHMLDNVWRFIKLKRYMILTDQRLKQKQNNVEG
jgi:hypothetical protein